MNILKFILKVLISVFLLLSIVGIIFYYSLGTTKKFYAEFNENEEIVTLKVSDLFPYHAKVRLKGHLSCDRQVQLLSKSKRFNQPIQLKEGRINEVIFDHDWYDDVIEIEFFSTDENCNKNEIKVIVTFYGVES